MDKGCVVDDRETTLPLLLSPVSRMSQWSDTDELVDPEEKDPSPWNEIKHNSSTGLKVVNVCFWENTIISFYQFIEVGVEAMNLIFHGAKDNTTLLGLNTVNINLLSCKVM